MDEFEKDGLQGNEQETAEKDIISEEEVSSDADEITESEGAELYRELEELKDLFQTELDKAMNGEEDDESDESDEADETEEISDEEEEPEEIRICECCGENPCDTSFGEDYPYCTECRKLMKANPFNAMGVLVTLLVLLVTGLALGNMTSNVDAYTNLLTAEEAYMENKLLDAATYYQTYLSSAGTDEGVSVSMRAVRSAAKTMASLGYYSDAKTIVETYFSEKELSKEKNKDYADIIKEYEILTKSSELINKELGEAINGGNFDYEKEIKKADSLIKKYKDNEEYNYTFLEYAKYLLMLVDGQKNEILLEQLKKIEEIDGGKHPWIYLTYLLHTYSKMGDTENADKVFEKCMEINVQENTLYNYYADAYRFCEKPDADKIMEIAQASALNSSQSDYPTYYRAYAVAFLLKGDNEKAMSNITQYLNSCSPTVSDFNLYALCAIANKDEETYKEAESTLKQYGYELSDTVKKCKEGKISVIKALTDKEGQI